MKNEEIKKYIETLYNLFYASNRFYYKFAKQYGISDIALFTLNIIYNSDTQGKYTMEFGGQSATVDITKK